VRSWVGENAGRYRHCRDNRTEGSESLIACHKQQCSTFCGRGCRSRCCPTIATSFIGRSCISPCLAMTKQDLQPAAAFHDRENRRNLRSCACGLPMCNQFFRYRDLHNRKLCIISSQGGPEIGLRSTDHDPHTYLDVPAIRTVQQYQTPASAAYFHSRRIVVSESEMRCRRCSVRAVRSGRGAR
jgi:hypothetical protein